MFRNACTHAQVSIVVLGHSRPQLFGALDLRYAVHEHRPISFVLAIFLLVHVYRTLGFTKSALHFFPGSLHLGRRTSQEDDRRYEVLR